MNTDNGALSFDAYINNEKLINSINEAEKRVKGFSDATVKEGEKIDDAFKITAENISIQKNVIAQLETQLNNLNIEISKMKPGTAQDKMKADAAQVAAELKAEKDALKQLEAAVKSSETSHKSFRTQVREAREELIRMEQAGLRGTPAYQALQKHLGELTDAMGDAAAQARVLANDERGFQGVVSTITGITGAFSAAQGAVGLFAGENEELNRIMLKVQSLMAITIGLQQVAEMLNKDSYFSIVILTKAKEMLAVAEMKFATALGISTAAARVLMATLTLGLSIAITSIIVALSKLSSKTAEARKEQQEFNKAVAEAAFEPVAAIKQLSTEYNALGNNMRAKESFIDKNKEKFEDLGIAIKDVNDAEKILSDPKTVEKLVEAFMLRAKAMAATEMASKKYKEALEKQMELDKTPEKVTMTTSSAGQGMFGGATVTTQVKNRKYTKLSNQISDLNAEGDNLFRMAANFTAAEKKILEKLGQSGEKITAGSIAAIEDNLNKLKAKYKEAATEAERNKLLTQIREQEKLLEKMDKSGKPGKTGKAEQNKDLKDYEDYRLQVIKKSSDAEIALKRSLITDKKALIEFDLQQELAAIDEMERIYKEKAKKAGENNPDLSLFSAMRSTATTQAGNAKTGVTKESYDALIEQYRNYEEQKSAIIADFDKKRTIAQEQGNQELIKRLNEAQIEALSKLSVEQLMESPDWTKLFGDLDKVATNELIKLRDSIESQFNNMNLSPEDLDVLRNKINEVTDEIERRNPFLALSDALKKYKKEQNSGNTKQLFESVAGALDGIKQMFDSVVSGLEKMGVQMDENTQKALEDVGGILSGASTLATGIATGNPLSIVQGTIETISNGVDLVTRMFDAKHDRSIKKHQQNIERLQKQYEKLSDEIDKSIGLEQYDLQKQQIENLTKQAKELNAQAQAEWKKKKTDYDKAYSYQDQAKEVKEQIAEIVEQIKLSLLNSDLKSIVSDLGGAIIDAFSAGEDAAKAWGNAVEDVVQNVVQKLLIQKLVSDRVEGIINSYLSKWVGTDGTLLMSTDEIMSSATQMGDDLKKLGPVIQELLNSLPEDVKKYLTGEENQDDKSPLTGAIQSVSEETASIISGQLNAIRINQIESVSILRNQLLELNKISTNTSHNINLVKLIDILEVLKSISGGGSLRSQGL